MSNHLQAIVFDFTADFYIKIQHILDNSIDMKLPSTSRGWKIPVDVYENADNLVFVVDVAGVKRDALQLTINEASVQFVGYRGPTCWQTPGFYHRMEIPTGHFNRTFRLPLKIWPEKGRAKIVDGMLYLVLPKQEQP